MRNPFFSRIGTVLACRRGFLARFCWAWAMLTLAYLATFTGPQALKIQPIMPTSRLQTTSYTTWVTVITPHMLCSQRDRWDMALMRDPTNPYPPTVCFASTVLPRPATPIPWYASFYRAAPSSTANPIHANFRSSLPTPPRLTGSPCTSSSALTTDDLPLPAKGRGESLVTSDLDKYLKIWRPRCNLYFAGQAMLEPWPYQHISFHPPQCRQRARHRPRPDRRYGRSLSQCR